MTGASLRLGPAVVMKAASGKIVSSNPVECGLKIMSGAPSHYLYHLRPGAYTMGVCSLSQSFASSKSL